jgi:hypothetical protein
VATGGASSAGWSAVSSVCRATAGNNEVSFDLIFDGISGPVAGGPIEGATVSVDDTDLEATTDADGNYTITGAPAGTWDVTASADGYVADTIEGVVVTAGADTSGVDFRLSEAVPEPGSISGTVTEAGTPGDIGDGDLHRCG